MSFLPLLLLLLLLLLLFCPFPTPNAWDDDSVIAVAAGVGIAPVPPPIGTATRVQRAESFRRLANRSVRLGCVKEAIGAPLFAVFVSTAASSNGRLVAAWRAKDNTAAARFCRWCSRFSALRASVIAFSFASSSRHSRSLCCLSLCRCCKIARSYRLEPAPPAENRVNSDGAEATEAVPRAPRAACNMAAGFW